eukprot:2197187-Rhodomonas_salina.4
MQKDATLGSASEIRSILLFSKSTDEGMRLLPYMSGLSFFFWSKYGVIHRLSSLAEISAGMIFPPADFTSVSMALFSSVGATAISSGWNPYITPLPTSTDGDEAGECMIITARHAPASMATPAYQRMLA